MTIHYLIATEIGRQRRKQIAQGVAASRRRPRRRWWERDFLPRATAIRTRLNPLRRTPAATT